MYGLCNSCLAPHTAPGALHDPAPTGEMDQRDIVSSLKGVKDAIGEWHDWEVLSTIAADLLDHGHECKLLSKLLEVRETKYALAQTNQMRDEFVNVRASGSRLVVLVYR